MTVSRVDLDGYSYNFRGQLKIYQRMVRSSFSLADHERSVLLFVLDRTIGWRRLSTRISMSEFYNGVFRGTGPSRTLVVRGTGLTAEQLTLAIARLVELGAIETQSTPPHVIYRIKEAWIHPELPGAGPLSLWEVNESDYVYREEPEDE
jgi:hypothetical protein